MSYTWFDTFRISLNTGNHNECEAILNSEMARIHDESKSRGELTAEWVTWNAELANLAIESSDLRLLKRCAQFWVCNENELWTRLPHSNYCFIRANVMAELSLHNYSGMKYPNFEFTKEYSNNVLRYYWKSWKLHFWEHGLLLHQEKEIVINHANALMKVGRFVEAIQNYDVILREYPDMPNALLSKADHLMFWFNWTRPPMTFSLFGNVWFLYTQFLKNREGIPPYVIQQAENGLNNVKDYLVEYEVTEEKLRLDIEESQVELSKLDHFRKFALMNFLALSEHAIYCPCNAARMDDLSVGQNGWTTQNQKILHVEGFLNRLKSEFALARKFLYDSLHANDFPEDVFLANVDRQEQNGYSVELARAAFRTAYGVLDKIARGLYLFYTDEPTKDIYFDTIWENCPELQSNVNEQGNIHLCALYSIALDLRHGVGELVGLREIRNRLEHEFVVLKQFVPNPNDDGNIRDDGFKYEMSFRDFQERTLHLLQLTRAAIFSFAYSCRFKNFLPSENVAATGQERIIDFSKL